ncbi:MAG: leucyl aminopeptidase [Cucumibacter sp.]
MQQDLIVRTAPFPAQKTAILVLFAGQGLKLGPQARKIVSASRLDIARLARAGDFTGRAGSALQIHAPARTGADRLVIIGTGKPADAKAPPPARSFADRGAALVAQLVASRADRASVVLDTPDFSAEAIARFVSGMKLRHYRFDRYRAKKKPDDEALEPPARLTVTLHVADKRVADRAIADRDAVTGGVVLARDLVNEPANVLGTLEFAAEAGKLADLGVEIEVLTDKQLQKLGMGALLAVAKGSARPARLVVMQWRGGKKGEAPIAFVGKGVVFDSGGISIKPASSMEDMKGDMGGAAAVTGLMRALAARKAKVNAVGVIGLVENMPSGEATRPGDILTSMSGQTIEVVNTDAEGRLVLADALWYTNTRFKPKAMIDLATLTGAIAVALGGEYAGLFSNNDELAGRLVKAGEASGDKLWRMPLSPAYDKLINSRFADIKNSSGRNAGASTAAQFLQRFVKDVAWAHLDIAGTAFGGPNGETSPSWASGYGVALLDQLVRDHYEG